MYFFFLVLYFCKASSFVSIFAVWIDTLSDTFKYLMNCPSNYLFFLNKHFIYTTTAVCTGTGISCINHVSGNSCDSLYSMYNVPASGLQ